MSRGTLFLVAAILSFASAARADEEFTGKVVGVADGDTVTVLRDEKTPVKIRLQAVDCPEKAQPFGQKAKQFTSEMVFGKVVTVKVATRDRHGGTFAWVSVGGKNLNEELLRSGLAWHDKHHARTEKQAKLELEARAAKRGLWADARPTPPWEWRHGKKGATAAGLDFGEGASIGTAESYVCVKDCVRRNRPRAVSPHVIEADCRRSCQKAASATGAFHGNTKSKVFHGPSCKDYSCRHCTAIFKSQQDAVKAGYQPHAQCITASGAGTPLPKQPWSKERACKVDTDCGLLPLRHPCACSPCGRVQAQAANKKAIDELKARWASIDCKPPNCPACAPLVVGDKALCINGQCQAR
jgi:micrococcal nuclease